MAKRDGLQLAVESRYIVGIDLGTTNTALAYLDLQQRFDDRRIQVLEIPQVVRPGALESRPLLPSFLYLPASGELPPGSLALPWDETRWLAVGEFARSRGKDVPGRLASSAKSWLCQAHVDRRAPLLPLGAPPDVKKLSPVEVSARILKHLSEAWEHAVGKGQKGCRLKQQRIYLCVPASFDAAARELTVEAAKAAGLHDVTLLEEPQAAFYAWLEHTGGQWRKHVRMGDLVLVVDIGGGTTDFTLIAVGEEKGALTLHRIAVGEHILLGGDNMDLALAHAVAARLASQDLQLDSWQLRALAHSCREAKELLLAQPFRLPVLPSRSTAASELEAPLKLLPPQGTIGKPRRRRKKAKDYPLAILGRGSGVVAESVKTRTTREEVAQVILDGFFGFCSATDRPERMLRAGLQELGLSYAADPSVSRHLARFLAKESLEAARDLPGPLRGGLFAHPTVVLFNGGVMKAAALCDRLVILLNRWLKEEGAEPVRVLSTPEPDLAVARGAVYYGLAMRGKGVRIRGGVARSYYIGVETAAPTVPGRSPPTKALCVVSFGMEEGAEADVPGAEFGLVVGEPAQFRFLSSTTRRDDKLGSLVEERRNSFEELAPIQASLPVTKRAAAGTLVPVRLRSRITAVGTLELWLHERDGPGKWKLEIRRF